MRGAGGRRRMSLSRFFVGCLVAWTACEPPAPVKNAKGERITSVELREEFATSEDPREVTFHGDAMRKAVELMDKRGVFDLSGTYAAKDTMHQATLVLV